MRKFFVAALILLLAHTPALAASGVISGAIRWDAWYENTPGDTCAQAQQVLSPAAWQNRAPWFAQVSSPYVLTAIGTQADMDAEIGYAQAAGLKFWAFNEYAVGSPSICIKQSWNLYQASSLKSQIKWTWVSDIGNLGSTGNYSTQVAGYITNMQDPQWQTVLSGRPLWFLFWNASNFSSHWGSSLSNLGAMITAVRAAATAASIGNPYIVIMNGNLTQAVQELKGVGADAIGYYNSSNYGTYSSLVSRNEAQWASFSNTGQSMIPTAVVGWDRRPFYQQPQSWYNQGSAPYVGMAEYTADGTVTAVADHIQDGVTWVQGHSSADPSAVLLVYAWSECAEGGANNLIPTLGDPPPSALLTALSAFLP